MGMLGKPPALRGCQLPPSSWDKKTWRPLSLEYPADRLRDLYGSLSTRLGITVGGGNSCPFTQAKRGIVRLNRISILARRENGHGYGENAANPASPGPAQEPCRRDGPQTAANRIDSSKSGPKFCDIKDLLAVQRVSSEPVSGAEETISLLNREKTGNFQSGTGNLPSLLPGDPRPAATLRRGSCRSMTRKTIPQTTAPATRGGPRPT